MSQTGRKTVKIVNHSLPKRAIRPHKEPPSLHFQLTRHNYNCSKRMLFLLGLAHSTGNQLIFRFVSWVLLICGAQNGTQTILTFLPPIVQPIINHSTIAESIFHLQKLTKSAKMTYAHIILMEDSIMVLPCNMGISLKKSTRLNTIERLSRIERILLRNWQNNSGKWI